MNKHPYYYPWHERAWQQLASQINAQRLPHALLISGVQGMAKKLFAERLARILLDESNATIELCNHPDYHELEPLDGNKTIKVEQIREMIGYLYQTTHRAGNRIIVINPAESMNTAAANALLKTLEEPPAGTYFLLVSHSPSQLPATVRSRCQSVKIYPAFDNATAAWVAEQLQCNKLHAEALLNQAEGSPQRAIELAEQDINQIQQHLLSELAHVRMQPASLLSIAERWQKQGLLSVLDNLISALNGLIKQRISNLSASSLLVEVGLNELIRYTQYSLEVRKELIQHPNLNPQLLSETLLFRWII